MKTRENVYKWLESGAAENCNLIADTQNKERIDKEQEKDFGAIENPYEKFFIYKYLKKVKNTERWNKVWIEIGKVEEDPKKSEKAKKSFEEKANKYKSIKDPDSNSIRLQEIYQLLWEDVAKKSFMRNDTKKKEMKNIWKDDRKISASDAMTSVQGVLKAVLKNIAFCDENMEIGRCIKKVYISCNKITKTQQELWTVLFSTVVVADLSVAGLDKEFYALIDKNYPNLGEFINNCFTVGNYCPVPKGFNSARSGPGACRDYWDITLMKICEWYREEKDESKDRILIELLHDTKDPEIKDNCKKWLAGFEENGGWRNFVDTLCMQDYVWNKDDGIDEDDEKYYQVKEFWEDHNWENPKLPKDAKAIDEALKKINKLTMARIKRIKDRGIQLINNN